MKAYQVYKNMWQIAHQFDQKLYLRAFSLIVIVALTALASTSLPFFLKQIVDSATSHSSIFLLILIYCVMWLVYQFLEWVERIGSSILNNNLSTALKVHSLENFLQCQKSELDQIDSAHFISDSNQASSAFSQLNSTFIFILLPTLFQLVFITFYLAHNINIYYAFAFLGFALLTFWLSKKINASSEKYFEPIKQAHKEQNSLFLEKVQNFYDIKVNHTVNFENQRFRQSAFRFLKTTAQSDFKIGLFMVLQVCIIFLFLTSFLLCSAYLFKQNQITIGDFILIISYVGMLTTPFLMLSQQTTRISQHFFHLKQLVKYFDLPKDHFSTESLQNSSTTYVFQDATFQLGKNLISHFNFTFLQNKVYAIVGKTGIGKTTFINYLIGLKKLQAGKLYYKNLDITAQFSAHIFSEIAFVGQNSVLYNGTLRENLIYNSPHCYTDDQLHQYLNIFSLENTLNNHQLNLNSDINTIIRKLSGGERQRLNIIRALLKKPQVLILDEPTSALDAKTGQEVFNYIKQQVPTLILITHSASYMQLADEILDFNTLVPAKSIEPIPNLQDK